MSRPLIVGHRGAPFEAPENSLRSLRRALELGADGAEFDVRLTADGAVVLSHDTTLSRCAGAAVAVGRVSLRVLQRYLLADGEPAPTLDAALDVLRSRWANIELKADSPAEGRALATAVHRVLVRRSAPLESFVLSSFEPDALAQLHALAPRFPLGILWEPGPSGAAVLRRTRGLHAAALHPCYVECTPERVAQWRRQGRRVHCWTVDDPETARALAASGVHALITNRPEVLRAALVG